MASAGVHACQQQEKGPAMPGLEALPIGGA